MRLGLCWRAWAPSRSSHMVLSKAKTDERTESNACNIHLKYECAICLLVLHNFEPGGCKRLHRVTPLILNRVH